MTFRAGRLFFRPVQQTNSPTQKVDKVNHKEKRTRLTVHDGECEDASGRGTADPVEAVADRLPRRLLDRKQQLDENQPPDSASIQRQNLNKIKMKNTIQTRGERNSGRRPWFTRNCG